MTEFCIGLAELFLIVVVGGWIRPNRGKFEVQGLGGFLIAGMLCYGLGSLTLLFF